MPDAKVGARVKLTVGLSGHDKKLEIDGVDVSRNVQGVTISVGFDEPTIVTVRYLAQLEVEAEGTSVLVVSQS